MWYEESTLHAKIAHIGVDLLTFINMGSILKLLCTRYYTQEALQQLVARGHVYNSNKMFTMS